jgi:hypothetical protein
MVMHSADTSTGVIEPVDELGRGVYVVDEDGEAHCFVPALYSLCLAKHQEDVSIPQIDMLPKVEISDLNANGGYSLFGLTPDFLSWLNSCIPRIDNLDE